MNSREMEAFLARVPVLVEAKGDNERNINELLAHPGLPVLLGLILGARQGLYAQVSYLPNGDQVQSHRISVLQGKIQGLEMTIQTVRELAVPVEATDERKDS